MGEIVEMVEYCDSKNMAAWLVNDSHYLILQSCENGWDYTFYTTEYRLVDGGQLDMPELSIDEACMILLEDMHFATKNRVTVTYEDVIEAAEAVTDTYFAENILHNNC